MEDWELIGYIKRRADGIEVNLDNVPEWIHDIVRSRRFDKFGRYYFKGRTFLYRIDVLPSEFDNLDVYIYRKLRYKPRRKRTLPKGLVFVLLTTFALGTFYFLAGLDKNVDNLVNDAQNTTGGFITEIRRSIESAVKKCEDGTLYGKCSAKKPLFCENGTLIAKASVCGCPEKYAPQGDSCVYALTLNPENRDFRYCFLGEERRLQITVYGGLNDYLSQKARRVFCERDYYLKMINDEDQNEAIRELVRKIESLTSNKDDQARIAISLVQKIPYDYEQLYSVDSYLCRNGYLVSGTPPRYPYQVLYDNKGVCGEKSMLLALLLKELGFGVALLEFEKERHMAVGIKCFEGLEEYANYRYNGSGYCFVETTAPSIVTDDELKYIRAGMLRSYPKITVISDGLSFDSVWIEYNDAKEWQRLREIAERNNNVLDWSNYGKWQSLVKKYCIEFN